MAAAAPRIKMPSKPDEKYSALLWPKGWSSSAGRAATVTIHSPNTAAARLTKDSSASDSKPTEPVTHQAQVLSAMVSSATAIDTPISRLGVIHSRRESSDMARIVDGLWLGRLPHRKH